MISGVTREIDGKPETFRLTTRAMMAVEDDLNAGIVEVLQSLEKGFRVGVVTRLIMACANDGAGRDMEWAQEAIDEMGLASAGELMGQVAEAAFPEAKATAGKNTKRAARSK